MNNCLRAGHDFTLTALTSTKEVFSFIRHSSTADILVIVNVMDSPTTLNLESLLLQVDIPSSQGSVLIRSSGYNVIYIREGVASKYVKI